MKVTILGAGLMGSQIGCEFALGGHEALLIANDLERLRARVEEAFGTLVLLRLRTQGEVIAARDRLSFATTIGDGQCDLVLESLPEDLALKTGLLRAAAVVSPAAILASNTSSFSIGALGDAVGAPERTIGLHYWNPPLLSPLVETIPGPRTADSVVESALGTLQALGKQPVLVERDVPGFIWNRLQLALLRECVWLVDHGVAGPETVDEVVREGLARRWRYVGPFQTIALGGVETWERVSENLVPALSKADVLDDLRRFGSHDPPQRAELQARRDRGLARELRHDAEVAGS